MAGCQGRNSQLLDHGRVNPTSTQPIPNRALRSLGRRSMSEGCPKSVCEFRTGSQAISTRARAVANRPEPEPTLSLVDHLKFSGGGLGKTALGDERGNLARELGLRECLRGEAAEGPRRRCRSRRCGPPAPPVYSLLLAISMACFRRSLGAQRASWMCRCSAGPTPAVTYSRFARPRW